MSGPTDVQLFIFRVAGREYALPVANVAEVLRMVSVAPLPQSPAWLSGVINLRGRVVPVMDLRVRLGLPAQPIDMATPLVIAQSNGQALGLVVDSAVEVASVPGALNFSRGDGHPLAGIARAGERLLFMLDLPHLMRELDALPALP